MPKEFTWVLEERDYSWRESTSREWGFFGKEETHWVLSNTHSEVARFEPADYRRMLKRQESEPCKMRAGAAILNEAGEKWSFDAYWFKGKFYLVNTEFNTDEIAGVIEDHEKREREKNEAREGRKADALERVRHRIRKKSE